MRKPWIGWGVVLGFALGGFFDGILLHQILQWHHLVSLVPGAGDLRLQVLWDGLFHALMYLVAVAGLVGLWRTRRRLVEGSGRPLVGALLSGFGLWHVVDSVLSHWVLGIHRIRLDSPNPLAWDLLWFVVFGVLPMAVGWLLVHGGGPSRGPGRPTVALLALTAVTTAIRSTAYSETTPDTAAQGRQLVAGSDRNIMAKQGNQAARRLHCQVNQLQQGRFAGTTLTDQEMK